MVVDKCRKDILVKKAIREVAKAQKKIKSKVSNADVFYYMLDNNLGKLWITELSVKNIRRTLPKQYQEK